MRHYLAGPMRGVHNYNFPLFDEVATRLRLQHHEVFNPCDLDREMNWVYDRRGPSGKRYVTLTDSFDFDQAMERDLQELRTCDAIVMLPGWSKSKGAQIELARAKELRKKVWYYKDGKYKQSPWDADTDGGAEIVPQVVQSTILVNDDPFESVLADIVKLNRSKRADYAVDGDPFSNFREAGDCIAGTPNDAVEVLIGVKQARLKALLDNDREPNHESITDTLLDRAVYSVIAVALAREASALDGGETDG